MSLTLDAWPKRWEMEVEEAEEEPPPPRLLPPDVIASAFISAASNARLCWFSCLSSSSNLRDGRRHGALGVKTASSDVGERAKTKKNKRAEGNGKKYKNIKKETSARAPVQTSLRLALQRHDLSRGF